VEIGQFLLFDLLTEILNKTVLVQIRLSPILLDTRYLTLKSAAVAQAALNGVLDSRWVLLLL